MKTAEDKKNHDPAPIRPVTLKDIKVSLILPDREIISHEILYFSPTQAVVCFPIKTCPELLPAEKVKLKVIFFKAEAILLLDAAVRSCKTDRIAKQCKFQLTAKEHTISQLKRALGKDFNRRKAFRVTQEEDSPIQVTLKWDTGSGSGRMIDISTSGMGLLVSAEIAQILSYHDRLHLKFNLPGSENSLKLIGTVPYSRGIGENSHYGIQIDWDQTDSFYRQEAIISTYVAQRQQIMAQGVKEKFIPIQKSHVHHLTNIALYFKPDEKKYTLYKPPGKTINQTHLTGGKYPPLYINQTDQIALIKEFQKKFDRRLKQHIESQDPRALKATLCSLIQEAFAEPKSAMLATLPETMDRLVSGYVEQPELLKHQISLFSRDDSIVSHSFNVMVLTINFCLFGKYSLEDIKRFGLSALLHDVGKIGLPDTIQSAKRRLTREEFEQVKTHPLKGYQIIRKESNMEEKIALGALEHHERLDGSGYPKGVSDISAIGQLLSIIDSFETLINSQNSYRRAKEPFDTLKQLKKETDAGKFKYTIFNQLCHSLI